MSEKHQQETHTAKSSEHPSSPEAVPALSPDTHTDHAHQLQIWLALPTAREQRRFLENHCDLLDEQSETILHDLFAQEPTDATQTQKRREALLLLQDAQRRGGTTEAIREAYVNLHGGFVLDLPPWLEVVEQRLTELLNQNRPEETAEECVVLLQKALKQIQGHTASTPTLLATMSRELADAWRSHPRTDNSQVLETAINFCEEILQIFSITRYPYQYAKTQRSLGAAYWHRIAGEKRANLEQAIACYQETLHIHTLNAFPFEYARVQNSLGVAYWYRIVGERRENLEQAIVCYQEALRVWTLDAFPFWYAQIQNNLGIVYWNRIVGERRENIERAIVCYQEALRVHTLDAFPFDYASAQNNLGVAYMGCIEGERRENLERAITCYQEALRVRTLDTFPFGYASAQNNLGIAYVNRIEGERRENLERAITCQQEALRVCTPDTHPFEYADVQNDLSKAYMQRIAGERGENLEQALSCYREALRIYTLEASPRAFRDAHVSLAEVEAQRENWDAVQNAYTTALKAEDLLAILGTGTLGRDAILKEGRDAAMRLGYALHRLGDISEAAIAMERGRARGLAEAMVFDAADPALITDEERRARYVTTRAALITAQANLHTPLSQKLDENTRRRLDLERTATYRQAKDTFDTLVTEIRAANDPAEFLNDSLAASTILHAAERIGPGHALVYLVATPWGGVAVTALSEQRSSSARFAALDLPDLTEAFVNTLIETRLQDSSEKLLGGFALAQMGEGFERMCQQWDEETFQAKVHALHTARSNTQQESMLNDAAQAAMACPPFASLAEQPLASLDQEDHTLLQATFDAFFLQRELSRCLEQLGTTVLSPVMTWLQEQGATSLTLIPCGQLAAFPLTSVLLPDRRSVGETLPTSVAPSARSLLHTTKSRTPQAGMATLGDPHENLDWSEAEALALTALARRAALPVEVHLKKQATRERLLTALDCRWMVNACCHGMFDAQDFLQSALLLANNGRVTMAEMLNHHADLRGLRLLLLSACQTAQLDLQGAHNEVHSLAAAMLQAGAQAVVAAQWAVDDKATYLLMVRFIQEWLPHMEHEPPAAALARAQTWLRHVTNQELAHWQSTLPMPSKLLPTTPLSEQSTTRSWQRIPVRGRSARWKDDEAQLIVRYGAQREEPSAQPYADPYYWAGFQVIGW